MDFFLRYIHLNTSYELILLHALLWNIFGYIVFRYFFLIYFFFQGHAMIKSDLASKWPKNCMRSLAPKIRHSGEQRVLILFRLTKRTKFIKTLYASTGRSHDSIALFRVSFSHLHYNVIQCGCEAISG